MSKEQSLVTTAEPSLSVEPRDFRGYSIYELVAEAHQRIMASNKSTENDREAMRLLEEAVLRIQGRLPKEQNVSASGDPMNRKRVRGGASGKGGRSGVGPSDSQRAHVLSLEPSRMLAEFHEAVSHPETDALWLRRTLHDEEHAELVEALDGGNLAEIARELADVVYVAFGTAHAAGINLDAALAEVHRANMHKAVAGIRRDDGKVIKPPDFRAPDMSLAVSTQDAATAAATKEGPA